MSKQEFIKALKHKCKRFKMKNLGGIVLVAVSVVLLLCCVLSFCLPAQFHMSWNRNSSIGIIGGADGPTSILLAGKIGQPWGLYAVTAVVIGVTAIYFIKKHK